MPPRWADSTPSPSRVESARTPRACVRPAVRTSSFWACGSIRRAAVSDRPVLVTGPTGAGKELVVAALHAHGPHPEEPILDLNCGAIPESLMESQLFGHEKGAFTGAERRQDGYFTLVRQGTLFLDEIAELPLPLQAKLLRVLETGRFRPVGSPVEACCLHAGGCAEAPLTTRPRRRAVYMTARQHHTPQRVRCCTAAVSASTK